MLRRLTNVLGYAELLAGIRTVALTGAQLAGTAGIVARLQTAATGIDLAQLVASSARDAAHDGRGLVPIAAPR